MYGAAKRRRMSGRVKRTELLPFCLPVRAEDEYALWLVLGEQSRTEIAQEVGKGAFGAAVLDHRAHDGILYGARIGDCEKGRAVAEEEGRDVTGRTWKCSEAIFPGGSSEREV